MSMDYLRRHLVDQIERGHLSLDRGLEWIAELERLEAAAASAAARDASVGDIAIIGMSGRFPGAPDLDRFAANLNRGVDAIGEVPGDRWPLARYYDPNPDAPNRTYAKWGGFLEHIDQFDPLFFRIAPKEAEIMDPQQRLFLETVWSALEDAGYSDRDLAGRRCGVFVGAAGGDFGRKWEQYGVEITSDTFFGNTPSLLPSRICYFLDLKGSALTLDTACSSSLVATHLACKSLIAGENDMMIAGGVCLIHTESLYLMLSKNGMLSPTGRCRAFDDGADGMVLAEGVGAVVLKRLDRALADGDRIDAVIRASHINQDGTTNGIAAPCGPSQTELEGQVYRQCGVDPETIQYVEAHGTGTPLGDPIELRALHNAFRQFTDKNQFCAIGSVKSNIGHAQTAAGIASLLKVVMALRCRRMFPTLHVDRETRHFQFSESPFYVIRESKPWQPQPGMPRRAAISSFGASGTNCHMVIEEPPAPDHADRPKRAAWLLPLSAKRPELVAERARQLLDHLERHPDLEIADICFTAGVGRSHFRHRWALIARDRADLLAGLNTTLDGDEARLWRSAQGPTEPAEDPLIPWEAASLEAELADGDRAARLMGEVARAYAAGAELDWSRLYPAGRFRRVALPTYPFHRRSYWITGQSTQIRDAAPKPGSLLDENRSDLNAIRFTKHLDRNAFYLSDHRMNGTRIFPGVAYLEMAIQAARVVAPSAKLNAVRRHTWVSPLQVGLDPVELEIELDRHPEGLDYRLVSSKGGRSMIHAQGRLTRDSDKPNRPYRPPAGDAEAWTSGEAFYATLAEAGMVRGETFHTVRRFLRGNDEVWADLRLPSAAAGDFGAFELHPGLADGLLQLAAVLLDDGTATNEDEGLYLPFALERLTCFAPLTPELKARLYPVPVRSDIKRFDIDVFDPSGTLLARFEGYGIRRITAQSTRAGQDINPDLAFFCRSWRTAPAPNSPAEAPLVWIGPAASKPSDARLTAAIDLDRAESIEEDLKPYGLANRTRIQVVIQAPHDAEPEAVAPFLNRLFHLFRGLRRLKPRELSCVVAISAETPVLAAADGFLRCLTAEMPRFHYRLVRLATATASQGADLARLIRELPQAGDDASEVRYLDGRREVTYLHQISRETMATWTPERLRRGGTYLVTGGTGGIGRALVGHLLSEFEARVAVVGRNQPSAETTSWFDESARANGSWRFCAADMTNGAEVARALSEARAAFGEIQGVFHCAGVTRDAYLAKKSDADFQAVLAPKVEGTLALHRAVADAPLDFLALFSSSGTMIANPGQTDYAAANRFMDEFAHWRNLQAASGTCRGTTVAISWPFWRHGGMRLPERTIATMEQAAGMRPLETEDGLAALRLALSSDHAHLGLFCGDVTRIAAALGAHPGEAGRDGGDDPASAALDDLARAWAALALTRLAASHEGSESSETNIVAAARVAAEHERWFAALQKLCDQSDPGRRPRDQAAEDRPKSLARDGGLGDPDRLVMHSHLLYNKYPHLGGPLRLLARMGPRLADILRGDTTAEAVVSMPPAARSRRRDALQPFLGEATRLVVQGGFPEFWREGQTAAENAAPDASVAANHGETADLRHRSGPSASPGGEGLSLANLQTELVAMVSRLTKIPLEDLDPHGDLSEFGMDSVVLTDLANRINDRYGSDLTPATFFEYETLAQFAGFLHDELGPAVAMPSHAEPPTSAEDRPPIDDHTQERSAASAVAQEGLGEEIAGVLVTEIGRLMKIPPEDIDNHSDLSDYGFDSVALTDLANRLNDRWQLDLTPADFFEYETIAALAAFLADRLGEATGHPRVDDDLGSRTTGSVPEREPGSVDIPPREPTDLPTAREASRSIQEHSPRSSTEVPGDFRNHLLAMLGEATGLSLGDLHSAAELSDLALDLTIGSAWTASVNDRWNLDLAPSLLMEETHLDNVVARVWAEVASMAATNPKEASETPPTQSGTVAPEPPGRVLPSPPQKSTGDHHGVDLDRPIAVIGMSAIFPGDNDLERWWQKILAGDFLVDEIPRDRFDWRAYFGDAQLEDEKLHSRWGGFIDDIDKFDAAFFKISPREAALMDPQHRIFLELSWRALEDAGIAPRDLAHSRTGVFVGITANDYSEILAEQGLGVDAHAPTGNAHCLLPNRISYLLNLKGPSEPVDTACSSSLVAIHRAVRSLQTGESTTALAGGVNALLSPSAFIAFSKSGNMLARDGKCKTFDAAADGYVRGEGAGVVVLKPLDRAQRDGDPIYAVIRGSAINHGGHAKSLTAPNPNAQADLLVEAYRQARFAPETIGHIEVHGTGTQLGDPIEINGLKKAFAQLAEDQGTPLPRGTCGLSSIKSNIGHLEGAAGIAGFIKILLAMRDRRLPATIHYHRLNPNIRIDDSPFFILDKPRPWHPSEVPDRNQSVLRAGVSSFGFGGANAHVALESYEEYRPIPTAAPGDELFVFSARNATALGDLLRQVRRWMACEPGCAVLAADMAHTLRLAREPMRVRLAILAPDKESLARTIAAFLAAPDAAHPHLWYSGARASRDEPRSFAAQPNDLTSAAEAFCAGSDVDWTALTERGRRIHMPGTQFERKRHWAGEGPTASKPAKISTSNASTVENAPEPVTGEAHSTAADSPPTRNFGPFRPMNEASIRSQKAAADLSDRKRAFLTRFTEHYCRKNATSKGLAQPFRARYADQRAIAFFHPTLKELCFPLVLDRAEGAEIWDVDGNRYIDIAMDFGCNLFGHGAPFLVAGMDRQVTRGLALGLRPPAAARAAELLCKLTGHERAVFTQSGTEAVMTAIRLARHVTERHQIVLFSHSYHGHADGVLAYGLGEGDEAVTRPISEAIPPSMVEDVVVLDYNQEASLAWIAEHGPRLAAVLVEPMQSRGLQQRPGNFLRELRTLTRDVGCALIFDEMITGFRIHPGGAQAWFGVRADLCTYGKVLGGGIGQGAIGGSARFLDGIDGGPWQFGDDSFPSVERTFFAGTHSQNTLGMAAVEAVLAHLDREGPALQWGLNQATAGLAERLNRHFLEERVPMLVRYFGSLFRFEPNGALNPIDQSLFVYALRDKGIMISEIGNNFLSTAHRSDHLTRIEAAVVETVRDLRLGGYLAPREPVAEPTPPEPPVAGAFAAGTPSSALETSSV
ncbi:Aminotransferase class III-fold pyridoxal phosphate-dependent enzyme [Sulfidibacter corallicola]|uniref:Aminotransferase class III-fold pyridoxal phosphate-dependent enzyme n=1 Tax=Sulfidibacter corallicola TaxID=2818388 RepID=A0A8A4TMS7_SULCO|nr:aminotransferase class III-fold pyridoxal phosphate-dependent enzyme [Sulfidibacter corallicola]QTD50514.1 aminotransferase class III-fold pyridoxal phosphate-dependent enzyme [Sulfidibacter corallicola]